MALSVQGNNNNILPAVIDGPRRRSFLDNLLWELGTVERKVPSIKWSFTSNNSGRERLVRAFLNKQDQFRRSGKPIGVQVAYHYTSQEAAKRIRSEGFRTSKAARGTFGRGLYVGNNPHAFRSYGEIGLIVLILVGVQRKMYSFSESDVDASVDSYHGNKVGKFATFTSGTTYYDEIVLRDDAQLLPLFYYPRELTNNADLLWRIHLSIQAFVDKTFPCGWPSLQRPVRPNIVDLGFEHKLAEKHKLNSETNRFTPIFAALTAKKPKMKYGAGTSITPTKQAKSKPKSASRVPVDRIRSSQPVSLGSVVCNPILLKNETCDFDSFCTPVFNPFKLKQDCAICLSPLAGATAVEITKCKHAFHRSCLKQAIKMSNKCPMCRIPFGRGPIGKSPFGSLKITLRNDIRCDGFDNVPTIVLRYDIPSGIQSTGQENPGSPYSSTTRTAYLPYTQDGRNTLKRLRFAFRRGLVFSVGTSLTTGKSNVVIWASIHHKTILRGGVHGWPDPAYFANVNAELDALHVPAPSDL